MSNRAPIPTAEIEKTTKDLEKFCAECNDIVLPATIPMYDCSVSVVNYILSVHYRWLWLGDKSTVVPGIKIKAPPAPPVQQQQTQSPSQASISAVVVSGSGSLSNVGSSDNIAVSPATGGPTTGASAAVTQQ